MEIKKFAVIGNPIEHSKSPFIHHAFAEQSHIKNKLGYEIEYKAECAPIDGFFETVKRLQAEGYLGANVTVPFKFEAAKLCDELSSRVMSMGNGAVNTLKFMNGSIHGDNTDGPGLRQDIEVNLNFLLQGKNVLILGAGGAAQGVLLSLVGAKSITVANRSIDKALNMITGIYNLLDASAVEYQELRKPFDLIVNATSVGLTDSALPLPDIIFGNETLAYDMMYGRDTPFMQQARTAGARVADGLGMLVEQAAEAFYLWHGLRPETAPVIQSFRQS